MSTSPPPYTVPRFRQDYWTASSADPDTYLVKTACTQPHALEFYATKKAWASVGQVPTNSATPAAWAKKTAVPFCTAQARTFLGLAKNASLKNVGVVTLYPNHAQAKKYNTTYIRCAFHKRTTGKMWSLGNASMKGTRNDGGAYRPTVPVATASTLTCRRDSVGGYKLTRRIAFKVDRHHLAPFEDVAADGIRTFAETPRKTPSVLSRQSVSWPKATADTLTADFLSESELFYTDVEAGLAASIPSGRTLSTRWLDPNGRQRLYKVTVPGPDTVSKVSCGKATVVTAAGQADGNQLKWTWQYGVDDFEIWSSTSPGSGFTLLGTYNGAGEPGRPGDIGGGPSGHDKVSYPDASAQPGVTTYYRLVALYSGGSKSRPATVSATRPAAG